MPEVRLTLTPVAREVLSNLLRLAGPAAARAAVNRALIPDEDADLATSWSHALATSASEELALLSTALAQAKGDPAIITLPSEAAAWSVVRALTSVRLTLRETVFPNVPDAALEDERILARLLPSLPSEQQHALACYDCFGLLQVSLIFRLAPEEID